MAVMADLWMMGLLAVAAVAVSTAVIVAMLWWGASISEWFAELRAHQPDGDDDGDSHEHTPDAPAA